MQCQKCGAQNNEDAVFCCSCGTKLEKGTICPKCGCKGLPIDAGFCPNCGNSMSIVKYEENKNDKEVRIEKKEKNNTKKIILCVIVGLIFPIGGIILYFCIKDSSFLD